MMTTRKRSGGQRLVRRGETESYQAFTLHVEGANPSGGTEVHS